MPTYRTKGFGMKFRLSTVFLLTLVVAVLLGWYVDRSNRSRHDIVGHWTMSNEPITWLGYATSLEINSDGSFIKHQAGRHGSCDFAGHWKVLESGQIEFHVESQTDKLWVFRDGRPVQKALDKHF